MKKWLIIAAFFGGIYHYYPEVFSGDFSGVMGSSNNSVEIFTYTDCGAHCDDALDVLRQRGIEFTHYDVQADDAALAHWKKRGGGNNFPTTMIGDSRIQGFYRTQYTHFLAKHFGIDMLGQTQKRIVQKQMEDYGEKTVVMYGAAWCPHCKKAREYFADKGIAYIELDAEKSDEGKRNYAGLDSSGYPLIYVGVNRFQGFGTKTKKQLARLL